MARPGERLVGAGKVKAGLPDPCLVPQRNAQRRGAPVGEDEVAAVVEDAGCHVGGIEDVLKLFALGCVVGRLSVSAARLRCQHQKCKVHQKVGQQRMAEFGRQQPSPPPAARAR